jgi:hypothetical protein
VLAESLTVLGRHVAVFGLALGAISYFTTGRYGRPARGAWTRGQNRVAKAAAVPLLVVGAIGLVLWLVGTVR